MSEPRPALRSAVAVGLGIGGVGCLVAAAFALPDDLAVADLSRTGLVLLTVLTLLGIGWLGYERHRAARITGEGAWWRDVTLACATALVLLASAGAAGWSLAGAVDQHGQGFVGRVTVTGAIGGAVVFVATLIGLGRPRPPTWRSVGAVRAIAGVLAVAAVAGLTIPLASAAPDWNVDSTTAAVVAPASVPAHVDHLAWTTSVPGNVLDLRAGGTGVLAVTASGLTAIDGTTGQVRWTYSRSGAVVDRMDVSPDGRSVLLQLSPRHGPIVLVGLDAITGRTRFSTIVDFSSPTPLPMTDAAFLVAGSGGDVLQGRSVRTGRLLWRFVPAPDCSIRSSTGLVAATPHTVLVPVFCSKVVGTSQVSFAGLDDTTGQPRWHRTVQVPGADTARVGGTVSPDGALVHYVVGGTATTPVRHFYLDTASGATVHAVDPMEPYGRGWAVGARTELIDAATGAPIAGDIPEVSCIRTDGLLLQDGTVCRGTSDPVALARFRSTGTWAVQVARIDGPQTRVAVRLGGPFVGTAAEPLVFVAAPGAVVVASGLLSRDGSHTVLAGLR